MERQTAEKIYLFPSLNQHFSGVGQPTSTKFSTVVEPASVHLSDKARWDKSNHFRGIDDEMHGQCAKN